MRRRYSLAHLTMIDQSPPDLVEIAARAGYDFVSLRLRAVTSGDAFPLLADEDLRRRTAEALRDNAIGLLDVELARLTPEVEVERDFGPMVEAAAALGARTILCQAHDEDRTPLLHNFRALKALTDARRLRLDMEFLTWTDVRTPADVLRLFDEAGDPTSGICVDTLHFFRSGGRAPDIADLPPDRLFMAQISDAAGSPPGTRDELIRVARSDRRMPGDGDLPLASAMAAFPPRTIFSIEVPSDTDAKRFPPLERAAMMLNKARRLESPVTSPQD